jgi:LSD1 subclass zinc finger protein
VTSDARVFPCTNCGASLRFDPGVGSLRCSSCGTVNDRPAVSESEQAAAQEELDYVAHLARQERAEEEVAGLLVTCPQCGATTQFDPHVVAAVCAFCATPLVSVTAHAGRQIRPRGLVPFTLTPAAAQELFRKWIDGRWFAPNALKRTVRSVQGVRGVYIPCWTFDARTTSRYVGQRGIDRIVSDTRRDANGNTVVVSRTVTDWYPASGTVQVAFDDTLVPASSSIPEHLATVLHGWDISGMVPAADEYVAGFTVEAYQLGLQPAFEQAKSIFGEGIIAAVRQDIGGSQQRVHDVSTRYDDVTFKHILLPVWICSYLFHDKSWRVVVNGQTGEVKGDRPWSAWKIAFAVIAALLVVAVLLLLNQG